MISFVCFKLNLFPVLLEQEAAFRKVVQATMVRDRQHGPVVELNRIQVPQNCVHLDICFTVSFSPRPSLCLSVERGCVPDRLQSSTCDVFHKGIFLPLL